jgi:hypothetical protein
MTRFRRSFGVEKKEKKPDEERRASFVYLYTFYSIRQGITTMPLSGKFFLICFLSVDPILEG